MEDLTPKTTPAPEPAEAPDGGGFPYATWGPWLAIGTTLAALIAGLLLSLPIILADGGADTDDLSLFSTVTIQICTGIGFVLVPLILAAGQGPSIRRAFRRLGFHSFETGQAIKWVSLGIVSYFVFSIIYSVIFGTPEQDDIAGDFGPIPLQILLIVIVAPFAEEICFRGMLFGGFRTKWPLWIA
ncbi:MAG: CPBP family intramembrane metalloprotease, partial [Actinomycetota bacterium]|nr:CPBP family intramembrane metalloprotease [Actinomycetota bacterium]